MTVWTYLGLFLLGFATPLVPAFWGWHRQGRLHFVWRALPRDATSDRDKA